MYDSYFTQSLSIEDQLPKKQDQIQTLTLSKQKRLQKNRISAHNSRLKKKQYVKDLQTSEKQLLQQIQRTQLELEKTKQQLDNILTKNKENDSFNNDEKPTYERLKNIIRDQVNFDEDEANMIIQLLIDRIGVTGKQRQRMIDYYTKRLINFSVPAMYRYLLKTSHQGNGLISQKNSQNQHQWDREPIQKLGITKKQRQKLKKMSDRIGLQKQKWTVFINQFISTRSQIYNLSANIQQWLLGMKNLFSIRQIGQMIIGVQNRKYNKNITLGMQDYNSEPVKKIKKQ